MHVKDITATNVYHSTACIDKVMYKNDSMIDPAGYTLYMAESMLI
jgi:hypothetical protein